MVWPVYRTSRSSDIARPIYFSLCVLVMRLFYGIEPDERSRHAAWDCLENVKRRVEGRFVILSNLHMTVCFAGEVDQSRVQEAMDIGERAALTAKKGELRLARLGYFGKSSNAILYIGVDRAECFTGLSDYLKRSLADAGLPCDPKGFSPHITIARKVRVTDEIISSFAPENVSWTADKLTLFESARVSGQLTYTPIGRWHFKR